MDGFDRVASESAVIALMRAGNHRGAEARLRTLLAQDPNNARALALTSQCRLADADNKAGLEMARAAAAIAPDDPLVKSTLTFALQRAGKGKAARDEQLQLAEEAASESPDDSDALFNLAIARFNSNAYRKARGANRLHQYAAARDLLDDAERYASDAYELINMAMLRLRQWDYDAAQALAQRAMQLDPTRPEIFTVLAECAIAQKRPVDAYELALEALRLSPGDPKIMRLLTRARARTRSWLKPFLPLIDWIVEMDRRGLVIVPALMCVIGFVFVFSLAFDLERIEAGVAPAIILSAASGGALVYALVSYFTAVFARFQIRRDLRRISLPKF
ncbi:MAG: tetratricopeptide repeat protein [Hyphomonadaceae bacterium]